MGASWDMMRSLASRDDPGQELLQLLNDPFKQELGDGAIWSALGSSIGITLGIAILFSFVRPYNTVVYAPKLKHSDEKHAPPPIGKGVFAWMKPLWSTSERDVIGHAGLDAAVFLRFTRMCRNIFLVLSVFGCAILIPVNWTQNSGDADQKWLKRITPLTVWNSAQWSSVIFGYFVNITICGFLWWNYRKILELRRVYFESEEYQYSLHARTLMINDLPKNMASDEGIARLIDEIIPQSSFARTAVARNVKVLPDIIAQHDRTVRKLESVLAKYLKDPKNLPAARPTCKPSKKDPSYGTYPRGQKVDAIEYLTQRIKDLEIEIKEVRTTLDKRNTLLYGFASYDDIGEAHCIAHALRKKKPKGATVRLAPRPNDIIWDNMPMSPSARSWNRFWNNIWIAILTMVWIVPNAMIAIFLVNLNNLGLVWTDFQNTLAADTTFWSIVQGILSPAITSLVYLVLPIIFRRLSIKAGDRTKTGRERHVLSKLYSFFVFNNLVIFSIFSTLWTFITAVIADTEKTGDAWQSLGKQDPAGLLFIALCNISPFWVTYLLQRQLGVATDLAQVWKLTWSFFQRKLGSPTPRELIELTAPPPFEYAMYYNYFLYYTTIALCYGGLQPLVLPAAALYFAVDVCLRKYLLLYIFVTKTESGGMFWRVLFNRIIFATMLANCLVFLAVWVRGEGTHIQAFAVVPLPFFMLAFKFYCARAFDTKIHYYATRNVIRNPEVGNGKDPLRSDRLASRFGHPALYKPLITPMVHSKAQNVLPSVYRGRISDGREAFSGDTMSTSGYSDAYIMNPMDKSGKVKSSVPGFELVPEGKLDFEYYKNRPEFASEHGGGEIYGRAADMMRPGTPGSMWNGSEPSSRPASPSLPTIPRTASPGPGRSHTPYSPIVGNSSPYAPTPEIGRSRSPFYALGNESGSNLVSNAAAMPMTTPGSREPSMDHSGTRAPGGAGMLGGGPRGYGNLPQDEDMTPDHDPMAYDYFRSSRTRRS